MTAPASLRDAADDLRTLAWLHAGEQPPAAWLALHEAGFPAGLSVPTLQDAAAQMSRALRQLQAAYAAEPQRAQDELAADFASIYLTHGIQASPYESVWLDEDHLLMQGPTFEVREAYRRHGLAAPNWRTLPDDHLTHQLSFVAALLDKNALQEASDFMAQHLMRWLPLFARRVAERAATPLHAALAALTLQVCRGIEQALPAAAPALA